MSSRGFREDGIVPRVDAQCVHCGALERHRFLWLYLERNTDLFDGKRRKMLHVAPELCFESRFRERLGGDYLTADLFNPRAMVEMDVTSIEYPDRSFDVVYCSHVLEHVHDDRKAMREFVRVLKNDGWAIINVPIIAEETFEDPSIVDPQERLQAFGQEDHVRRYGPDYVDRLRDAGFEVAVTTVGDLTQEDEVIQMGLTRASGEIFFCTKPGVGS
jgi:SAM-dependent methyltransferase